MNVNVHIHSVCKSKLCIFTEYAKVTFNHLNDFETKSKRFEVVNYELRWFFLASQLKPKNFQQVFLAWGL